MSGFGLWLLGGALFGLGIGLLLFLGLPGQAADDIPAPQPAALGSGAVVGAVAPDFSLQSVDGVEASLSDYRGEVVLLNFWATWCAPCRLEMPAFQQRYRELAPEGLQVLAVNFDESEEEVRAFQQELDLSFPLLLDPGGMVQRIYRVLGYPTTYLVDRDGVIQAIHVGIMSEAQLDGYLLQMGMEA